MEITQCNDFLDKHALTRPEFGQMVQYWQHVSMQTKVMVKTLGIKKVFLEQPNSTKKGLFFASFKNVFKIIEPSWK